MKEESRMRKKMKAFMEECKTEQIPFEDFLAVLSSTAITLAINSMGVEETVEFFDLKKEASQKILHNFLQKAGDEFK